ncbi:protein dachsous [Cimex lectularius]|uniref:Protocadherin-16 n=1 Tax=Cimex lectularius TaxID=79782 RepID=A0A8I6RL23_CIMLE|nr:protein dachsous [Cimex lectularius]
MWRAVLAILLALLARGSLAEQVRELQVPEGAPTGTRVGFIWDGTSSSTSPPYLIVSVPGSAVDSDLDVEEETGEIRTKVQLDRETRTSYSLVAISRGGGNVRVVVRVLDENDNAPTFPSPVMEIEFPENTPRDVKRTLNPARDLDLDVFNTQRYNIISGNLNNAFRLSSHREKDGVLYLDLQINGFLDRETTSEYSLVIQALDGGNPPLSGSMTVNITIQDVNDNQPIFNQSRYFATVPENATVGTSILQVFATDTDAGENGEVEYSINRRQSDRDGMFRIDPKTGLIAVNRPLDFETKEVHELVVVAKDHGAQPLETTAFVSITVTDVNDNQPTINVIFLSDDATPKISERAEKGEFVARISVNDPDSKTEYSNVNVTLEGGEDRFGLKKQDNLIYLVIVSMPIDRELKSNYTLSVIATDTGTPPLHASRTFHLRVTDVNDNSPEFSQSVYHANVLEVADPGTSVFQITATDKDEGENSVISYKMFEDNKSHPPWFQIDHKTGLITTKSHIDCETDPVPRVIVVATDNGNPPLSSSATVLVTIHDVNDNEPIFEMSFYNGTVQENQAQGHCFLKVAATDPDCGVNAMVNYTLGETSGKIPQLMIKSDTGEICIASQLDYETRPSYEFPVIATDRGGLSTRAIVKIQLMDVNDNWPVFYPREYNVSLREGAVVGPVVAVAATDRDSGRFGTITYSISAGNSARIFTIDQKTGEISLGRPERLSVRNPVYKLNVTAVDGGGLRSQQDAEVYISITDSKSTPPHFQSPRYDMSIREDARPNTVVGTVKATNSQPGKSAVRYSIYSGDPDGYFNIDPASGVLRTTGRLDHEHHSSLLLNVQATSGSPPAYGHAQVHIEIEDVNDNAPRFASSKVRISVRESEGSGTPLYTVHAEDADSGEFGRVVYRLLSDGRLFRVDPKSGDLFLKGPLDYESAQRHSLVVSALDGGSPPLTSNLTILLEVQDVNDNPPVFERTEYTVPVSEALAINSQVVQVTAVDLDTGNNARLTYKLLSGEDVFGIFPNSGWIYLRGQLDREAKDRYGLRVAAEDNGSPASTATALVTVLVTDANDNDPSFTNDIYEFVVEENQPRGAYLGRVAATDMDLDLNAAIAYTLIPTNSSFQINPVTGEIRTREVLDREKRSMYELVAEAKDQGVPPRSSRVTVRIVVTDVNDNAPEIVDPREDVVSIREEQAPGTEVVKVRAVDRDNGQNATVTYSILKGREGEGWRVFSVDPVTGVLRTKVVLESGEKDIYRVTVAATDSGNPPKQSVRTLSVEVLALYDHRPTFSSSSLHFKVSEAVDIGYVVGNVIGNEGTESNLVSGRARAGHLMYTLTSISPTDQETAFDLDRSSGSLVVTRKLDRESCSEYRLEVRALDTSTTINHQSSAVIIKVEITDVNDNTPTWEKDLIDIDVREDLRIGSNVWNFSATDTDFSPNGDVRYSLVSSFPKSGMFSMDPLTGSLTLISPLDFDDVSEFTLVVRATDQAANQSDRLSSTITARLRLTDVNDNSPVFFSPKSKDVYVKEGMEVGSVVVQVLATDKDSGENGRVTYDVTSGNSQGKFSLGYETGHLTLLRPLDVGSKHNINVTATDHGNPPKSATIPITITVKRTTESPPKFSRMVYNANVSEDATIGSFVTRVDAKSSSEEGGNVTYWLGSENFRIDQFSGVITVSNGLDREVRESYQLVVYATEGQHYSTSSVYVAVTDVNDHAPKFPACYSLAVPENSDFGAIHRLQAYDEDSGPNSEITYTIIGGNVGNRFSIDLHSGELSARSLDREVQSRYRLVVSAQDKGSPPKAGICNLTVTVEDQNDNDPVFAETLYVARVKEDTAVGTLVLNVTAQDQDQGLNARIVYSLANESQALFRIDPDTGHIFTAGMFDREKHSSYVFQVVATDSGRYDARSQKVPVQITIEDVNDNKPVFSQYPFIAEVPSYNPSGKELLKVTATDADEGTNADIVYSFLNEPPSNKFRMDPKSGIVTTTSSLAMENGRIYHLEILATDRGNPPHSASSLIEIKVGEGLDGPNLRFPNSTYTEQIPENSPAGTEVVQVSAVRSDGRRQKITYSLVSGNEESKFEINSQTGMIRVRNSAALDYEVNPQIRLTVQAQADSPMGSPLFGYAQVNVNLIDLNDNAPKFTQSQYSTTVWEGNNKGTFVMQVSATDIDQGSNSQLLYHIVEGNHDNAFIIEPSSSGIVKMNIVLDREIRDNYKLTVIATDEGMPQLTGTSTILVNIVDVNDNQPTFPPHSVITINEGKEVGSVLTSITANDVDTNPALTYNLSDSDGNFSIDRFSGKVTLCHKLDYERKKSYKLNIMASDTAHTATTMLTILVTDGNDNPPQFTQPSYHATIPANSEYSYSVLTVNAVDLDSEKNAKIIYSLLEPHPGFFINEKSGVLSSNRTAMDIPQGQQKTINLRVKATDSGKPSLSSVVTIRINIGSAGSSKSTFTQTEYRISTKENTPVGTTLLKMTNNMNEDSYKTYFTIVEGNVNNTFQILSPFGELVLVKYLDREKLDSYLLKVTQGPENSTTATVHVIVEDSNDNSPVFNSFSNVIHLSEDVPVSYSIAHLKGMDEDLPPNSDVRFDILSGNDENLFAIDSTSGLLSVDKKLDFDRGFSEYSLVIGATDGARTPDRPLRSVTSLKIVLDDENDNAPHFPVTEYLEFVGENEPIGSTVFTARATDLDRGVFGRLNYSIETASSAGYGDVDESWKMFKVDSASGLVTTNAVFDYELRSRYAFTLLATDHGAQIARVKVRVEIESRDEYYPQFTERTYRFVVNGKDLPVGFVIGNVVATDRDKGPDGRIVYQLTNQHAYFKVNRTTGAVMIKKKLDSNLNTKQEVSFVVRASSGRQDSLTNMSVVEISLDPLAHFETNLVNGEEGNNTALAASTSKVADWAIGLLISLIIVILCFGAVFLFLHMRNRRQKNVNKSGLGSVQSQDNYVDPSNFDTIPVRGGIAGPASQFGPPKYEDIPTYRNKSNSSNSGAATTSQISGSDQSGSSGRGSAEDGDDVEDEEIRMINEGIQREGGLHRSSDDNMSDVSVQNTQEYLARLGIVNTNNNSANSRRRTDSVGAGSSKDIMLHAGVPIDRLRMYDEDGTAEADITNLIYAKLTDVGESERCSSGEEGNSSSAGPLGPAVDHVIGIGAYGGVPVATHQPSMTGSLSSIVHSEEELTGSYNWDYLLDWGPQYQPLAHVFSEIARLKDDAASVKSGTSGTSSGKGKCPPSVKSVPPPLLTSVAPRSIAAPVLSARGSHHPPLKHQGPKIHLLPRSPINHDGNGAVFGTSAAMSPSFSPALSPLATSPSLSPIVTPRHPSSHHVRQRTTDTELRI